MMLFKKKSNSKLLCKLSLPRRRPTYSWRCISSLLENHLASQWYCTDYCNVIVCLWMGNVSPPPNVFIWWDAAFTSNITCTSQNTLPLWYMFKLTNGQFNFLFAVGLGLRSYIFFPKKILGVHFFSQNFLVRTFFFLIFLSAYFFFFPNCIYVNTW